MNYNSIYENLLWFYLFFKQQCRMVKVDFAIKFNYWCRTINNQVLEKNKLLIIK